MYNGYKKDDFKVEEKNEIIRYSAPEELSSKKIKSIMDR